MELKDRLFVATRKGLFEFHRTGSGSASAWTVARVAFLGDSVSMFLHDQRDGSLYAGVGHGHFGAKMHRSINGGETWQPCGTPTYPDPPEGVTIIRCPNRGVEIPWSLELIWSLEAGGPAEPGLLWCGTIPGGLFRSTDHGATWELNRSLWDHPSRQHWFGGGYDYPGIHSICVDPRDARRIYVAISCGGVWLTEDGGQSWNTRTEGLWAAYMPPQRKFDPYVQDPHRLVSCPAAPDTLWIQHHNGAFRSTDGGLSWTDVSTLRPSTFGFAVAVHPKDPRTAWFVPAVSDEKRVPVEGKVAVARTRDGGENFVVLGTGLPPKHAYDITFRHALDVDESGNCLAFGSTTGSLWATNDQGEHWYTISANLPPIHCVRFA